ncbi:MAG: GHMP kinase [Actinomycetia bacterium]|nr:GHMP kinase [Actinomycetes bacterium]
MPRLIVHDDGSLASWAPSRVALVGNPSDGFGGRVLAVAVANFGATVHLEPAAGIELVPGDTDATSWSGLGEFVEQISLYGHLGGVPLMQAAIKTLVDHQRNRGRRLPELGFRLSYETTIPRSVGLAGSSAIVVAVQQALAHHLGIDLPRTVWPSLVLRAETDEMGIDAGLQDRVAQVYGGVVEMDFGSDRQGTADGVIHGRYEALDASRLPPLYVSYLPTAAEPSGVYHGSLRARYYRGEPGVVESMRRLAGFSAEARAAVTWANRGVLGQLIDATFDVRRALSDLPPLQVEMVDTARAAGASANFAGSGGAIAGVVPDGDEGLERLTAALAEVGATTEALVVADQLD